MIEINDNKYNEEIIFKDFSDYFLIYFYTNVCHYCLPVEEELLKIKNLVLFKINLSENQKIRNFFNIRTVPFVILCDKNKRVIYKKAGSNIKVKQIERLINEDRVV